MCLHSLLYQSTTCCCNEVMCMYAGTSASQRRLPVAQLESGRLAGPAHS